MHAARGAARLPAGASATDEPSKVQRQQAIARLIGQHPVTNQPQLVDLLGRRGHRRHAGHRVARPRGPRRGQGARARRRHRLRDPRVRAGPHRARGPAAAGDGGVGGRGRRVRPTSSCCARRRAAPTSSPRRSTAAGSTACSAPSPATTRCCASPTRRRPATTLADRLRDLAGLGRRRWLSDGRPTATRHDALARPLRRRPGRGAAGLHRQPAVRPAAVARRHRRLAGPRRRAGRAPGCSTDDEARRSPRRARPGRRRAGERHVRVRRRATRTSTPPSSAGSPSSPVRPAPSCTPAAAATTRSPPTCGCGASAS